MKLSINNQPLPKLLPRPLPGLLLATTLLLGCGADTPNSPLQQQVDKLVFVKGGSFQMGDAGYTDDQGQFRYRGGSNTRPVHQVTLSSYSLQAYEATYIEFDAYTQAVGESLVGKKYRHIKSMQGQHPAKWMTWYQARGYCQWLGKRLGYPMDLPTEAQWEYAARSRGKADVTYATDNGLQQRGRNIRDPEKVGHNTVPVGSWPPNPLGLYDMTGNVNEWTLDLWHPYDTEPLTDPNYNNEETRYYTSQYVTRGGGLIGTISLYTRKTLGPENTGAGTGVRCAVNHPEAITAPANTAANKP